MTATITIDADGLIETEAAEAGPLVRGLPALPPVIAGSFTQEVRERGRVFLPFRGQQRRGMG
jgi:hypothetical protein